MIVSDASLDELRSAEQPKQCAPLSPARQWHDSLPQAPRLLSHPLRFLVWLGRGLIGTLFGITLLAGMAAVPGLNILALGFLLELVGRVARSGRFRDAFYLTPLSARLGGIVIFTALLVIPLRLLADVALDARLLAPGTATALLWTIAAGIACLAVAVHVLLVIGRGGSWWWFFRPISNLRWTFSELRAGRYWQRADQALADLGAVLRLWHHLRLGLIGYAGVYAWIALPTLVFSRAPEVSGPLQSLCLLVGGTALVIALGWLPFLQSHFAETGRWRAFLELGTVRRRFRHSPFCWTLSAVLLFGLSMVVMLYVALVKNKLPPHPANWDVMVVFFATILPAKILIAWAWHRSAGRPEPWRVWQWFNRLLLATALAFYVYFLLLARTGGQLGEPAIWQFHALLLPSPW